jgi:hypothetical protein
MNVLQRHLRLLPLPATRWPSLAPDPAGLDGAATAPRTKLQHLSKQDKGGDHRCRFKIDRQMAGGKERNGAVDIGGATPIPTP